MARLVLAQNLESSMCMDDKELERALARAIMTPDHCNVLLIAHAIVARADKQTQTTKPTDEPTTPRSFPA